jgi:hypothetical protein
VSLDAVRISPAAEVVDEDGEDSEVDRNRMAVIWSRWPRSLYDVYDLNSRA